MRLLAFTLTLVAALARPQTAAAGQVEDRQASVKSWEVQQTRLAADQQALYRQYADKAAAVDRLKKKSKGFNDERKLEKLQAEGKELSRALDVKQAQLRQAAERLAKERQALLDAIDRELAGGASPATPATIDDARRARLARLRAEVAGRLPAKRIKMADERIDPRDDPEDLEAKAADLARTEKSLAAEIARMDRRATDFHRRAKLASARERGESFDVIDENGSKRTTGSSKGVQVSSDKTNDAGRLDGNDDADTAPPPALVDGFTAPTEPAAPPAGGASETAGGIETTTDLSVVYQDVVQPGTLDELKRAERSNDPEAKARAAERARDDLKKRAERARLRRQEMEKRARQLRDAGE